MSVYKRPGQDLYSFDFHYRRQRFSGPTGCTSRREAEKFEAAERERLKTLRFDASKPLTFKAAAGQYWNEIASHLRNSDDALRSLDWLERQIGPTTLIAAIDDAVVARAVAKRRGENVSPATVNRTVTQPLRAILGRARRVWKQVVAEIEWRDHWLREPQERIREASREEELRFMKAIRGEYKAALRFAILTGCRRAEIVGLKWQTVDFFRREFTVLGKGSQLRVIPMTTAIYDLLWSLKDHHSTAVFTYLVRRPRPGATRGTREPITIEGFKTEWRRTKVRAKVDDFRFHDTRHTAATRLVRATGNLKQAQKLLGHADIATTARYAHVTNSDLRAGMEAVERSESASPVHEPAAAKAVS